MTPLVIIPARAGSQGIPDKHTRRLGEHTIVDRAVDIARHARLERIVLTTDIGEYLTEPSWPIDVIARPPALATAETPLLHVIRHAIHERAGDPILVLQPTAPLRTVAHITRALTLYEDIDPDSIVSVVEMPLTASPDYLCAIASDGGLQPWLPGRTWASLPQRRQDARPAFRRDGTIYLTRRSVVDAGSLYGDWCVPLVLDPLESLSLDSEADWLEAELRLAEDPVEKFEECG